MSTITQGEDESKEVITIDMAQEKMEVKLGQLINICPQLQKILAKFFLRM
jgi:hypothetical protein